MNNFFGDPLFQPTGIGWIDHAFTAAILDEEEAGSDTAAEEDQSSASTPMSKMTPELREAMMQDPKIRDAILRLEKSVKESQDFIRSIQRGLFW